MILILGAVINAVLYGGCLLALLRKPREQPLLAQFFIVAVLIGTAGYALVQPLDPMPFVILAIVIAAYPAPRALVSFSREGAPSIPLLVLGAIIKGRQIAPAARRGGRSPTTVARGAARHAG